MPSTGLLLSVIVFHCDQLFYVSFVYVMLLEKKIIERNINYVKVIFTSFIIIF